jgi:hypothetical protein
VIKRLRNIDINYILFVKNSVLKENSILVKPCPQLTKHVFLYERECWMTRRKKEMGPVLSMSVSRRLVFLIGFAN